jgi:hypothetical protein
MPYKKYIGGSENRKKKLKEVRGSWGKSAFELKDRLYVRVGGDHNFFHGLSRS